MTLIILSLIVASITYTVTRSNIFASFRLLVKHFSPKLGELVSCGYFFGHWVSFVIVGLYRYRVVEGLGILDYFLTALLVAWLNAWQWPAMTILLNYRAKTIRERKQYESATAGEVIDFADLSARKVV